MVPLVAPTWSLFYELAINIAYAVLLPFLSRKVLLVTIILSGAALSFLTLRMGSMHYLHETIAGGLIQTVFSFSIGVWIHRNRSRVSAPAIPISLSARACYVLTLLALAMPNLPAIEPFYELGTISFVFPAIVAAGLRTQTSAWPAAESFLGELSYPIYLLHIPVAAYVGVGLGWIAGGHALFLISCVATIVASGVASRFYDAPVRRWIGARTFATQRYGLIA